MLFLIGGAFMLGGSGFFTVNLLQRHNNDLLVHEISLLRYAVQKRRERYPLHIDAWVVFRIICMRVDFAAG